MLDTMLNPHMEYKTWYTFERDLKRKLGRFLNVDMWLNSKPKKFLPWNDVDLQTSLSEVLRIQQSLGVSQIAFRHIRMR